MLGTDVFQFNLFPGQGVCVWKARYANPILRFLPFFGSKIRIDYAVSLCSPNDEFDIDEGVHAANRRMERASDYDEQKGWTGTFFWTKEQWERYVNQDMVTFALRKHIKPLLKLPWPWERMIN